MTLLLSACCQVWDATKRVPWFPFARDQFMKPRGKQILIEKGSTSSCRVMQTKIGNSTSSTASSHSRRGGNGSATLSIDSVTKNTLNFDCVCECDHELNDCVSNSVLSRSWCKRVESKNESKEIIKSAMDNSTRTKIMTVATSANTLEWFFKKMFFY